MKKLLLTSALVGVAAFGAFSYAPSADAGWGPPFACGAGKKTGTITWDGGKAPSSEPKAAVTGAAVKAPAAATESEDSEWSIDELKAGKPILVYYYIDGMEGPCGDENYKFSQNFEEQCLDTKLVERLNANWTARKVAIDPEADRKLEKNQARIEIWSFTGQKLTTITVKERGQLSETNLLKVLKQYQEKNTALCAKEIKRIEAAQKAREEADKRTGMAK